MKHIKARIAGVVTESVVDGPGVRAVVFFQGCNRVCPGCHNPETWDINGGQEVSLVELIPMLKLNPLVNGITFSGGEPFLQAYPAAVLGGILKEMGLTLWVYTGFTWEDLLVNFEKPGFKELLRIADIVIDGPFIKELKSTDNSFKGSHNQRIINAKTSLMEGRVVIVDSVL